MRSTIRPLACAGLVAVGLWVAASAQDQPAQQQPPANQTPTPTFRTGINFVRVDVIVSDRNGGLVGDLKQTDFEVSEDGKPQAIESFKLIKLDGGTTPTAD